MFIGLFLGACLPFLFAALSIDAVGWAAQEMIEEVRRQFREIPGLREGQEGVVPDSARCVAISTSASLKEMVRASAGRWPGQGHGQQPCEPGRRSGHADLARCQPGRRRRARR